MIHRHLGRCAAIAALLAIAVSELGCASTRASDSDASATNASGGTNSTTAASPNTSPLLTFDSSPITVSVLSQVTVGVHVSPALEQTVAFALVGDSLDASLQVAQVSSDATGQARVTLNAPSTPTTFTLRASIDRSSVVEAAVTVTTATTGTIDISAKYAGTRQVQSYNVQVFPNADCSLASEAASATRPISVTTNRLPVRVESLPVGTPLAVVVDGDHTTVRGCVALRNVTASSTVAVEVPLEDLPLNLYGQSLGVAMTASDGLSALQSSLRECVPAFVSGLVLSNHDLTELLSEMEKIALGSLKQEFSSLRSSSNWDSLVVSTYASVGGIDLLRRQLRDWLTQGIALLSRQPSFEVALDLGPRDYSTPQLSLIRIAGLDAATHLSMQSSNLALSFEAGDRLNWSSTLSFNKAILVDALAFTAAAPELPGVNDVPSLLARRLDCDTFVSTLDQNAVWSNANSRVCNTACLGTLCRDALGAMYRRATSAAFDTPTTPLFLNASGPVTVNDSAQPIAVTGTWTGVWSTETAAVTLEGTHAGE